MGSYGGYYQFLSLAVELNIDIAYWDEWKVKALKSQDAKWDVFTPSGVLHLTAAQIDARDERPVVHVAWSRCTPKHFEAYVCDKAKDAFKAPEWLKQALEKWKHSHQTSS